VSRRAWFLVSVVAALIGLGLVFLYSATAARCENARLADPLFFLRRQLISVLVAVGAMIVASRIPTAAWGRLRWPLLLFTFLLLGLVLVPGIGRGKSGHGAQRWLDIAGFSLQPSEMAKLTLALFLCGTAADAERLRSFFRGFLPTFGILLLACALIARQPDVGTAIFLALVMGLTLFAAGLRFVHLAPCALLAAVGGWLVVGRMGHVRARIDTWLNPDAQPLTSGLQVKQSLIALGSGGLWGEGLGRGIQKLYYLPEVHADFIFPVIGEELGFSGTMGILALYLLLGASGWSIARRAGTRFGFLFSCAMTWLILIQAAFNVAVVTASVPAKGIPLPFVSHGGSALIFTMIGIGILIRVANEGEGEKCAVSSSPGGEPAVTCIPASR